MDVSALLGPCETPDRIGTLGDYEVESVVGRGGMGVVLKAHDRRLNRVVAVKVLAPEFAADPVARRRFAREARAAAAVSHPHVVVIHAVETGDVGASRDGAAAVPHLVMEYVAGRSLQQKLDAEGALEVREILRIGTQTARGLAAAHAQGLTHRDVKPGNVLLENGVERVKLSDFGLARAADDVAVTRPGDVAGTPGFMSPEQAEGKAVDGRSDLFGLGAVLYAMCVGRPPFRGASPVAVLRKVCDEPHRPVREANPDVPPALAAVVDRLLCKDPAGRFATADEVADRLETLLADDQGGRETASGKTRPLPAAAPAKRSNRPRRWATAAAALVGVLACVGAAEATGVTDLVPTVVRLVRGEGVLVVTTSDPGVGVTVEGEDLVITGAGTGEIRLTPGTYAVTAERGGEAFRELVTVERNGRQVVNVRWEPIAVEAAGRNRGAFDDFDSIDADPTFTDPAVAAAEPTFGPVASGDEISSSTAPGPRLSPVRRFEGHAAPAKDVAVSADGRRFASASGLPGGDGTARLWDAATAGRLPCSRTPPPSTRSRSTRRVPASIPGRSTASCGVGRFGPTAGRRTCGSNASTAGRTWPSTWRSPRPAPASSRRGIKTKRFTSGTRRPAKGCTRCATTASSSCGSPSPPRPPAGTGAPACWRSPAAGRLSSGTSPPARSSGRCRSPGRTCRPGRASRSSRNRTSPTPATTPASCGLGTS